MIRSLSAETEKPKPEKLVSADTVADYFGCCVRQVWRWVKNRRVPFVKDGRLVRFNVTKVEDALTRKAL
jgi:excisionase family DNA binding protein